MFKEFAPHDVFVLIGIALMLLAVVGRVKATSIEFETKSPLQQYIIFALGVLCVMGGVYVGYNQDDKAEATAQRLPPGATHPATPYQASIMPASGNNGGRLEVYEQAGGKSLGNVLLPGRKVLITKEQTEGRTKWLEGRVHGYISVMDPEGIANVSLIGGDPAQDAGFPEPCPGDGCRVKVHVPNDCLALRTQRQRQRKGNPTNKILEVCDGMEVTLAPGASPEDESKRKWHMINDISFWFREDDVNVMPEEL